MCPGGNNRDMYLHRDQDKIGPSIGEVCVQGVGSGQSEYWVEIDSICQLVRWLEQSRRKSHAKTEELNQLYVRCG